MCVCVWVCACARPCVCVCVLSEFNTINSPMIFLGEKDLLIEQNKDNARKTDEAKMITGSGKLWNNKLMNIWRSTWLLSN